MSNGAEPVDANGSSAVEPEVRFFQARVNALGDHGIVHFLIREDAGSASLNYFPAGSGFFRDGLVKSRVLGTQRCASPAHKPPRD
jgi:hypothetical protein